MQVHNIILPLRSIFQAGFERVAKVKISDQIRAVMQVRSRFPGLFARIVSFPVNQVKESSSQDLGIKYLINFILSFIFNYHRRWRILSSSRDGIWMIGFK